MSISTTRVSIVIPVYNEAEHLGACLRAIADQSVSAYEVIVVDNNSTDATALVAQSFPFVTLIREPRQGVVNARDAGFDLACGDIIGRLDADSIIAPNWVATLQQLFDADADLSAVTGQVQYYGVSFNKIFSAIDLRIRRHLARVLDREVAMQGANMALRRSAWRAVSPTLCRSAEQHEDFDVSIHLSQTGHRVVFDDRLIAAIDSRRLESNWPEFRHYVWLSPATYAQHGLKSHRHMYPVVALAVVCYLPLKLLRRGFNAETERFSWQTFWAYSGAGRVNPATFVD